ncbi:MAG: thioredoxin family protein [Isosphaeraceae bacterium]
MRKIFLSLASLALIASPAFAGKYNKVVNIGDKAPTFSGIPAVEGSHDTSLSLGDMKEDVVVLVFLNNECPYVTAVEDRLIDFANDYKGKSVKLVGVSVVDADNHRLRNIKEYVKKRGENFAYGYDESQAIGVAYGATNTPQFFVLDKNRVIRYMGALDDQPRKEADVKKRYVRDAVDALLAGKSPEIDETRPIGCGIQLKNRK